MAEDAARELPNLALEDALQLVHLYAERGSPKYERAARRWLVRYLTEGTPSMRDAARVTVSLAKHAVDVDPPPCSSCRQRMGDGLNPSRMR